MLMGAVRVVGGSELDLLLFKFSSMDIYGRRKASAFGCVSEIPCFSPSPFFFFFLSPSIMN